MLVSAMQSGDEPSVEALFQALPTEALRGLDPRTLSSLLFLAIQKRQQKALASFVLHLARIRDINAASCHILLFEAISHKLQDASVTLLIGCLPAALELEATEIGKLLSLGVNNDMPGAVAKLCSLPGSYRIAPAVAEQLRAEARRVWGDSYCRDDDEADTGGSSEGKGSGSSSSSSSPGGEGEGSSSSSSGAVGGGTDHVHVNDQKQHEGVGRLHIWAWDRYNNFWGDEDWSDSDCDSASNYFESEDYKEGSEEYEEEEDYCENLASLWPQYEHYV